MIRIGDFSKLSQVSIKTLRYYDKVGLLKPNSVDGLTGYRSYSVSQLPRLNRILALKDLGFSLEQIAQVLDEGISAEQLRGMLRLKRAELQQRIADEQARLARVEARLNDIATEDALPYADVVLKQIDPHLVAGSRGILPTYPAVGRLFKEVYGHLARVGVNGLVLTGAAIWHNDGYEEGHIDGEAVVYLKQPVHNTFNRAYEAVVRWIETNSYSIAGPNREIYLYCTQPVRQDDDSYVTEIQFPVVKRESQQH